MMKNRGAAMGLLMVCCSVVWAAPEPANLLIITADDLNCNFVGAFNGLIEGLTPSMDQLAREGLCFDRAHVTVAVCQPSRQTWMTGLYPHNQGAMGFIPIRKGIKTLGQELQKAGYYTAILGKVAHHQPIEQYGFDAVIGSKEELPGGRDPQSYARQVRRVMDAAEAAGKPFFILVNTHDPHAPLYGSEKDRKWYGYKGSPVAAPSKVYTPEEVVVPGFLPDLPQVRKEVAQYASSVRRSDDTVGAVLAELEAAGRTDQTMVMFLGDNGMPFPYAKANSYLHSTRTPWIVRWPGVVQPGSRDADHFVSGIDLMPTVLDSLGVPIPDGLDGKSFLPLLRGGQQDGRDQVYTAYYRSPDGTDYSMRAIQIGDFRYIFNAFSLKGTVYDASPLKWLTFEAMEQSADPAVQQRVQFLKHRPEEELYNLGRDPDALHDLAPSPEDAVIKQKLQQAMLQQMKTTSDPLLPMFINYLAR